MGFRSNGTSNTDSKTWPSLLLPLLIMSQKLRFGGFETVFTGEEDREICADLLILETRLFGIPITEFRCAVLQVAELNKKQII